MLGVVSSLLVLLPAVSSSSSGPPVDVIELSSDSYAYVTGHGIQNIHEATIATWLRMTPGSSHNGAFYISDRNSRFVFLDLITNSGANCFQLSCERNSESMAATTDFCPTFNDGAMHHVVIARHGTGSQIDLAAWVDGQRVALTQRNGYGAWNSGTENLKLGGLMDNNNFYGPNHPSSFGDFRVYNTALDDAQVASLYAHTNMAEPPGVQASWFMMWYRFVEGQGATQYASYDEVGELASGRPPHASPLIVSGTPLWISGAGPPTSPPLPPPSPSPPAVPPPSPPYLPVHTGELAAKVAALEARLDSLLAGQGVGCLAAIAAGEDGRTCHVSPTAGFNRLEISVDAAV